MGSAIQLRRGWFVAALAAGLMIASVTTGLTFDQLTLEKTATLLLLPVGLSGLLLLSCVFYLGCIRRWCACAVMACLACAFWVLGSPLGAQKLSSSIERGFQPVDVNQVEPFDWLIVLGGGVMQLTNSGAQLTWAGDRVMLAARLWHAGKVRQLVATGGPVWSDPGASSSKTDEIWKEIAIPEENIKMVPGRNTSEEMARLKQFLKQRPVGRVGLLTSAWHMRRALRLAAEHKLYPLPVAADFYSAGTALPLPLAIIPDVGSLTRSSIVIKEWLAGLVNR